MAVRVGDHLRFDVARPVEKLLDKTLAATEGGDGLAHRRLVQVGHFVHAPGDLHAAAAAAERGLDDDGQAVLLGKGQHLGRVLDRPGRAGHQRRADFQRDAARLHLVAERGDGGRRRADPGQAGGDHGAREARVLRQEAVARMHRVGAAARGHGEQLVDVQVGVGGALAVQAIGFVGHARVQRVEVGIGIHRDRLHAVVGTGANDAHGDLAAVGDQDFLHGVPRWWGWVKGIEAHAGADGDLAGAVEVVGRHGADHRVAARQRVVGQEQHGLPAGRHLDGAEGRAFARQLGRVGARQRLFAGQAKADAVGLRRDLPHLARQQRH